MEEMFTQWSEKQYLGRSRLFVHFDSNFFPTGYAVNLAVNLEGKDMF